MSHEWTALLGMAGAALVATATASAFVIQRAIAFGRFLQRIEHTETTVARHEQRIAALEIQGGAQVSHEGEDA